MYRDPSRNVDGLTLEADHTLARSQGGTRADRLLLATCNRSRGDGTRLGRADSGYGQVTGGTEGPWPINPMVGKPVPPWQSRDWLGDT
jgi:hypothetical protein